MPDTAKMDERELRWRRVRAFASEKGLDALLIVGSRYGEPLDRYVSNWIPGCTVIFPRDGEPTLLVPMIPHMLSLRPDTPEDARPWIQDVRGGARGASILSVIEEKGLDQGRIGVVGLGSLRTDWEGWIPAGTWNRVIRKLPKCALEDVTEAFAELLLVKSSEELDQVRRAAQALEQVSREMLEAVKPGVSEAEIYALVRHQLFRRGVDAPTLIMRSGPDTVSWGEPPWLFGVGSPRILQPGDVVLAEIFARCGGLEAQVQIAVAIPPVSAEAAECARLAAQAYQEGLKQVRPGRKFAEVVTAMEAPLDRPEVWYLTPQAHSMNPMFCIGPTGVGIETLPDAQAYRGLGTGRIRGGDLLLQPGMVFELEPNACIGRQRVNVGGTVIVTENGAEPLNEISTQMRLCS